MPNPPEPDHGPTPKRPGDEQAFDAGEAPGPEAAGGYPVLPSDAETEVVVISQPGADNDADESAVTSPRERRFTAPGFDAKETAVIATTPEPATEAFPPAPAQAPEGPTAYVGAPPKAAVPQSIPPRLGERLRPPQQFNWGWVLALVLIVLALAAIAILGTVLLTRTKHAQVSQEDQVRHTIQSFDIAVQRGDLTQLRTITCGTTRDGYVDYDEHSWEETYRRVSAAKQYPVIASIDQVVVNGQHAEANITTFMAYDPQLRSTRSLDLQYRDDQWKICQSSSG